MDGGVIAGMYRRAAGYSLDCLLHHFLVLKMLAVLVPLLVTGGTGGAGGVSAGGAGSAATTYCCCHFRRCWSEVTPDTK